MRLWDKLQAIKRKTLQKIQHIARGSVAENATYLSSTKRIL